MRWRSSRKSFRHGGSLWVFGGRLATVIIIGGLHFGTAPLTNMMLQRYIGFITTLMELRADVVASSWAGGPEKVALTIAADRTIHRSGIVDLGRSLVSLSLSHFPESERAELLRNRQRLLTPKLRYFALSLILSIMQPLNGAVFAYFPQQLALLSVGAMGTAQMVAAIIMIAQMRLAGVRRIGALRMAVVAATTTIAAACSQINFERTTVAFFLYSELAAFPLPGEAEPAATVITAALGAGRVVVHELMEAAFSWAALSSIATTSLILRCLFRQAPRVAAIARGGFWPVAILAASALAGTLAAITTNWPAPDLGGGYVLPLPQFSLGPLLATLICLLLRFLAPGPSKTFNDNPLNQNPKVSGGTANLGKATAGAPASSETSPE